MVTKKFKRESRLLTPVHFKGVFSDPVRFSSQHFTLLTTKIPTENSRLGLTIAKKRVKLAVQRNRIKRITRESFRLNQQKLPNIDIVVMVKSGIDQLDNEQIRHQIEKLWRKIIQRYNR